MEDVETSDLIFLIVDLLWIFGSGWATSLSASLIHLLLLVSFLCPLVVLLVDFKYIYLRSPFLIILNLN